MICRTPAQSRPCERGLWVGEEEVWSPRRLGCEQGAAPASLCSPGLAGVEAPGPRGLPASPGRGLQPHVALRLNYSWAECITD